MQRYLQNVWYLAAWDHEVPASGVLTRRLLDRKWVIYRLESGAYALMEDRCPHRFVPLSLGERRGDVLHCRYHGLGFDPTGACVHNPFPAPPPSNARVHTMPVTAKYKGIWFWPGDPALADPARIPDFSFVERDGMKRDRLVIKANYELLTDNLMDLTHAEFIHQKSFGANGSIFGGSQTVKSDESGAVWNNWDIEGAEPADWTKPMLRDGEKVDQWLYMRWHAPASMALTVGLARAGSQRKELIAPEMVNPHIITPETQTTSHYFFEHEDNDQAAALARQVFIDEDEPMIEAAQEALGDSDFWDAKPAIIAADAGAIAARRRLMQMRRTEEAAARGAE